MKVYIKNKFWSLGGDSSVVNANKEPVFIVKGRIFSYTKVKYVCDLKGRKLYKIRNRWFNPIAHKAYIYDKSGTKVATLKDKWISFKNEYEMEAYGKEVRIEGAFFSLHSDIIIGNKIIASINRKLTIINDAFELEGDINIMPFLIALVIGIDNITDKKFQ